MRRRHPASMIRVMPDDFINLYRSLDPAGQAYVAALVELLHQDVDGTVLAILKRHQAGERVADEYLDLDTNKRVRPAPGEPVGGRWVPVLAALDTTTTLPRNGRQGAPCTSSKPSRPTARGRCTTGCRQAVTA